jgi:hypothetical protein
MLGLGTLYATAGLGWTPGPGQTPADDPRMVREFGKVRQTYKVRNIPSAKAADAASAIFAAGRRDFAGNTVRKASGNGYSNGWGPGGRVGFDVIFAQPTRLGEIKSKGKAIERGNPVASLASDASLYDAQTGVSAADLLTPPGAPPETADPTPGAPVPPPEPEGNFLTQTVGGVPVWAIGGLGIVAVGGLIFALTRKKAPTPNRRRRRRRR